MSFSPPQEENNRPQPVKKVFVKSFGCQMNVYDAERMTDILAREGFSETPDIAEANLVILNTCHIREKAVDKVYSDLGRIRTLKQERAERGEETRIVVAGCVAQAEGREILRRAPAVDIVVGPQTYHRLPELLSMPGRVVDTEFPAEEKFAHLPATSPARIKARGLTAFLTIQEGCDKFCTFCVVPYTRGAEMSRSVTAIVEEAQRLTESGVKELTLIGQNVNAYHGEGPNGRPWSLAQLFYRLAEIPGLARLRYSTSHPRDMDDELIHAHRDLDALMPFLHLPVQSGSDRILAAMNRGHKAQTYREIIAKLRSVRPDIALSSDFIVGFPGETDEDFAATMELIRDVGFATSFSFKYSSRPGTPAAEHADQVSEEVKAERLARLQVLLEEQRQRFNQGTIGRTVDVLLEKPGRHPGQIAGKTPYQQAIVIEGRHLLGEIIPVRVTKAGSNSLFGAYQNDAAVAAA